MRGHRFAPVALEREQAAVPVGPVPPSRSAIRPNAIAVQRGEKQFDFVLRQHHNGRMRAIDIVERDQASVRVASWR